MNDPSSADASSDEADAPPDVRIYLLGEFGVRVGDRAVEAGAWRLNKAKDVVKMLALAPRHRLHREQVIEALWPERDPVSAANNLHQVLHAARQAVGSANGGSDCIRLSDEWLDLCPERGLWVDADAFEAAAASYDSSRHLEALDLYRGELLPEDRYSDWAAPRRDELRQRFRELLSTVATQHEENGDVAGAIELWRRLVEDDPVNEPGHRGLMRTYARSGDRGAAIRQFERLDATLRSELGVAPDETSRALRDDILTGRIGPPPPGTGPPADAGTPHNVPVPLSSFVGRERELTELPITIAQSRLVTLTGAGGTGKTRLAGELARRSLGTFDDGVLFVELAPLGEPAAVERELVHMLGVRERRGERPADAAVRQIGDGRVLLVLDNCEHLIEAAAGLVGTLLGGCPRLAVLATSREPLRISGEIVRRVPSLPLPDSTGTTDVTEVAAFDAVRLFVDRAAAAHAGFELDETNAADVVSLCSRLDGLPLALELAAARAPALTVAGIVEHLDDRFRLLTGGERTALSRQRTLAATVEWSYDLLSEAERAVFRRLAVFHDRFDLDTATVVCEDCGVDAADIPVLVSGLAERSMVVPENGGRESRFRLLETMREYGTARLRDAGEFDAAHDQHSRWMLDLVEQAAVRFAEPTRHHWLAHLESYRDDLRATVGHLLATDPDRAMRLVGLLWPYWLWHGDLVEGHRWIRSALDQTPRPSLDRAEALLGCYALAVRRAGLDEAEQYLDEGVAEARAVGGDRAICRALLFSGIHHQYNDYAKAEQRFAAARTRAADAGLAAEELSAVHALAVVACASHRFADSHRFLTEARQRAEQLTNQDGALLMLTLAPMSRSLRADEQRLMWEETWVPFQEVSGRSAQAYVVANMGKLARTAGDVAEARACLDEALALYESADDESGTTLAHLRLGQLSLAAGEFSVAQHHLEQSLAIAERIGDTRGVEVATVSLGHVAMQTRDLDTARALLDHAERLCRKRSDGPALGMVLSRQSMLESRAGDTAAAVERAREQVGLRSEMNVALDTATAWSDLADACAAAGDPGQAASAAAEAVARLESIGYHEEAEECRRRLTESGV